MSEHLARIFWKHAGVNFTKGQYSREHIWTFDGGVSIAASPSPANVPAPYSNASMVDPEEAFVASIASCHMLVFLQLASRAQVTVTSYTDNAIGTMSKNERGVPWVSAVLLQPDVRYAEPQPTAAQIAQLHHCAHDGCFIANSVKTQISVETPTRSSTSLKPLS